jgi:hypothetical protein
MWRAAKGHEKTDIFGIFSNSSLTLLLQGAEQDYLSQEIVIRYRKIEREKFKGPLRVAERCNVPMHRLYQVTHLSYIGFVLGKRELGQYSCTIRT